MHRLNLLWAVLLIPACTHNNHDGQLLYTSPGGLQVWGAGDDTQGAFTGPPTQSSNGFRWLAYGTWDDLGAAMDNQVLVHIAANPQVDPALVWQAARMAKYYLEDDYAFPDIGKPVDAAGTSYAAGETIQNPDNPSRDVKVYLAVWTKNASDTAPDVTTIPLWTYRQWSTSPLYTWGSIPWVPGLSYELGWLDGVNPGSVPVVP